MRVRMKEEERACYTDLVTYFSILLYLAKKKGKRGRNKLSVWSDYKLVPRGLRTKRKQYKRERGIYYRLKDVHCFCAMCGGGRGINN